MSGYPGKGETGRIDCGQKVRSLSKYWYYNSNIRGVVYAGLSRDIEKNWPM